MDIFDLLIPPFYFMVLVLIAVKYSTKHKATNGLYKYFMPGLLLKMFGAVALGLVYFYYYEGGDTVNYYYTATTLLNVMFERPDDFLYLYFGKPDFLEYYLLGEHTEFVYWVNDEYAFFVSKCFVPILLICFKSYIASAILVATICYLGVWRLFLVFVNEFPQVSRQFSWSILYIPSVIFWGSGLMKDSITFSSACIYVHGFYWFFAKRKWKISYLGGLLIASSLLISIKPYILFALLPGSLFWFASLRMTKIKNMFVKIVFAPALIFLVISVGLFVLQQLGDSLGKYSIEKVMSTASGAQQDLKQSYYGGNSFDIGDYEPTPAGLLSVSHKAIFATLFRPTLIDVRNIQMVLSAIENTFILLFCVYLLLKLRVYRFFSLITEHPLLMFSFVFSVFFAFSVGVSIANFGALVRLKIPCIPFFLSSLVILNELLNQSEKKRRARMFAKIKEEATNTF